MSQIVVLLGKPGAGKDTQADFLSTQMNYKIIKTGDFARSLAKKNKNITQTLQRGQLVDNGLINRYVADEILKDGWHGRYLTDGFPRDLEQAKWFDDFLSKHKIAVTKVILLDLPDEMAKDRLLKRGRTDDTGETIDRRLGVYRDITGRVIDYYRQQDKLISVDAAPSPSQISTALREALA